MVKLSVKLLNFIDKLAFMLWGVNLIDLTQAFDFEFLQAVDGNLKIFLAIIGAIYFLIQIVFKTLELNHKRKYNKGLEKLQEEEIRMRMKENDDFIFRKDYFEQEKQNL